jgi:hypothetical protein
MSSTGGSAAVKWPPARCAKRGLRFAHLTVACLPIPQAAGNVRVRVVHRPRGAPRSSRRQESLESSVGDSRRVIDPAQCTNGSTWLGQECKGNAAARRASVSVRNSGQTYEPAPPGATPALDGGAGLSQMWSLVRRPNSQLAVAKSRRSAVGEVLAEVLGAKPDDG